MAKIINKKKIMIMSVALIVFIATIFTTYDEALAIDAYGRAVGIDVSAHNGVVDWNSVKNSGIDFAIIRVGIGDNEPNQHDRQATRNMNECDRLGIPYGVYIYSYALTLKEVNSEVDHVITMLDGRYPELGIWFDMEDADGYKYNHAFNPAQHGAELTNFCLTFIRGIKDRGYNNVGVYANKNYFTNILNYDAIRAEGMIWLAHWGISEPSMGCELWQYSSDGNIPGAGNRTDMNYIYPTSSLMSRIKSGSDDEDLGITVPAEEGRGDIDDDGVVSSADYNAIKRHIIGMRTLTDETALERADINEDGVISSLDYVEVKKLLVSLSGSGSIYATETSLSIPVGGMGTFNIIGDNVAGYFTYSQSGPIAIAVKDGKDNYIDNNKRTFIVTGNSAGNASITFNVEDGTSYNGESISGTSFTVNVSVYQPQVDPGAGTGGEDYEFSAPAPGSSDTSLAKLEVEGFELIDEGNDIFSCSVGSKVKKVKVIAEANDKKATVTGDGEKELADGENDIEVIVEAENGFSRSYKIVIQKEASVKEAPKKPTKKKEEKKPENDIKISTTQIIASGAGVIVGFAALIYLMILFDSLKKKRIAKKLQLEEELLFEEHLDEYIEEDKIDEPIEGLEFIEQDDGQN